MLLNAKSFLLIFFILLIGCSKNESIESEAQKEEVKNQSVYEINTLPLHDALMVIEAEIGSLEVDQVKTSLSFKSQGHILAKDSASGVELVSRNITEIQLELVRIPETIALQTLREINLNALQINGYNFVRLLNNAATPVWSGTLKVKSDASEAVSTIVPLQEILKKLPQGLFALVVADKNDTSAPLPSTLDKIEQQEDLWEVNVPLKWILNTNIGVTTARYPKGMLLNVRSLDQATPFEGAQVKLFTQANEQIFQATADKDGWVEIPEAAVIGRRANAPSHIVVAHNQDLAYIDLNSSPLDLSAFNVGGRHLTTKADAFVFTDRGVYRPREIVYVTAIVRDLMGRNTITGDLDLVVLRPNGSKHFTRKVSTSSLGAITEEILLPADAPRGIWKMIIAHQGEKLYIGSSEIDVQDFVPEKLKVEVVKDAEKISLGNTISTKIQVDYLFGAPGVDLGIEAEAFLRTVEAYEIRQDLSGFEFGDKLQPFRTGPLKTQTTNTNDIGLGLIEVQTDGVSFSNLPNGYRASLPSRAQIQIGVQEPGGRTTKAVKSQEIFSNLPVLAIKPKFKYRVNTSDSASFEVKKFSPELEVLSLKGLEWDLRKHNTKWDYDRSTGRWKYSKTVSENMIERGQVTASQSDSVGQISLQPLQWGEYVLTVMDDKDRIYLRSTFYSGWSSNADTNQPDFLELKSEKHSFKPNSTFVVGVESPYAGKGVLTVWTDRPVHTQSVKLELGTNTIQLKTHTDWYPGAYVVVSALRPLGGQSANKSDTLSIERYLPARAMGVLYLKADIERSLTVTAPDKLPIQPRSEQTLNLSIPQLKGKTGYVIVKAVDQGILQLTNFQTPAPQEHFFGKRRLQTNFYDYYNQLIRADGHLGEFRTGGDSPSLGGTALDVVPTKSTVIYSGPVSVDQSGQVKIKLPIPDFNGSLKTMATVWSDDSYGSFEQVWVVRDPVVADMVMPRFIAPGDESTATLLLVNTTEFNQRVSIGVKASGELSGNFLTIRENLSPSQQKQIQLPIKGTSQGQGVLAITLNVVGQEMITREWPISVIYSGTASIHNGPITKLRSGEKTQLSLNFATQAQATGRSGYVLINQNTGLLSSLPPTFSAANLISDLAAYRWTCSEQISSTFTPVVMAYQSDPTFTGQVLWPYLVNMDVRTWLQNRLDQVIARQSIDGSIGLWKQGDDNVDPTLAAQLVEMLAQARLIDLDMPEHSLLSAFAWATKLSRNAASNEEKYRALTRMLKAMQPHSPRSIRVARGLADQVNDMDLLSKSNLAVTLKRYGDNSRLDEVVAELRRSHQVGGVLNRVFNNRSTWRYHEQNLSQLMQHASNLFELGLMAEAELTIKMAINEFQKRGFWSNINEKGNILRAHIAIADRSSTEVIIGDTLYTAKLGSVIAPLASKIIQASNGRVTIESRSSSPLSAMAVLQAPPNPKTRLPASSKGITVDAKFFKLDGVEQKQGLYQSKVSDRFIVYIDAKMDRENFGSSRQIMISSPVPAGFQIEMIINNNVREDLYDWLPELTKANVQQSQDTGYFASSIMSRWERHMSLAYIVRATTPGQYLAVETVVEDMYDPTFRGSSGGQYITVLPNK